MKACTSVLIVKVGAIGDVVMALHAVTAARAVEPDARISWVCGSAVAPLLRLVNEIDELITVDDRLLLSGSMFERLREIAATWRKLAGRRFDLIANGHADPRYRVLTLPVFASRRRTWSHRPASRLPIRGRYHGDEYVRLMIGGDGRVVEPARLPLVEVSLPEHLERRLSNTQPVVVLAPGGARNLLRDDRLRRWPLARYVALAKKLTGSGAEVVLVGAPSDAWVRDAFEPAEVVDLIGETDLVELYAVLSKAHLIISHDSGPMHLAALARTPLIALFGPTDPGERSVPSDRTAFFAPKALPCAPCYDGRNYAKCDRNICLEQTSVERVFRRAHQFLSTDAG